LSGGLGAYTVARERTIGGTVTVRVGAENTWTLSASCRGPESALFFPPTYPERKEDRDAREARAKAICRECPVRMECLDYAVRIREPHGIWGGLTESERRLMYTDDN
jgi:WhiB family redox-sensing transcriptional regulator